MRFGPATPGDKVVSGDDREIEPARERGVGTGFSDWAEVMDGWGSRMLAAVQSAAQLAAEGLGLPLTAFSERMAFGPHLLAPTGS